MTREQQAIYRAKDGLWANACAAQGWDPGDEKQRRAVTLEAARKINPASTCDSTTGLNEDQITALFRLLVAYARPLDLEAQCATVNPEQTRARDICKRLVYAINECGFHRNYPQAIARWYCRTEQVSRWEDLSEKRLRFLLITVNKNAIKKKQPHPHQEKATAVTSTGDQPYQMKPRKTFARKPATSATADANPF